VDVISFKDNQSVIDLIEKRPKGIIPILEELCFLGREISVNQIISSFDKPHNKVHPNYAKPRFGNEEFIVKHFAGDVLYDADGLISKNNDSLHDDLKILLSNSTSKFLVSTCTSFGEPDAPGYVEEMTDLMRTVSVEDDEEETGEKVSRGEPRPNPARVWGARATERSEGAGGVRGVSPRRPLRLPAPASEEHSF
jgi:hypothetical protein